MAIRNLDIEPGGEALQREAREMGFDEPGPAIGCRASAAAGMAVPPAHIRA